MPPINYVILNELSFQRASSLEEAAGWLTFMLQTMKTIENMGFKRIKTRNDFQVTEFAGESTTHDVILRLDRDECNYALQVFDAPYLGPDHENAFLSHSMISVLGETRNDAEGLLSAYIVDTMALSFGTHDRWDVSAVDICVRDDTTGAEHAVSLPHACTPDHPLQHLRWAARRTAEPQDLIPTHSKPLPNTSVSDLVATGGWAEFYKRTSSMSPAEKTARLREVAPAIAWINGFDESPAISKKNAIRSGALRQVFVSAFRDDGSKIYLSTDFENNAGAFEVCDNRGRHLGEWLFSGRRNGNADTSGRHDLAL